MAGKQRFTPRQIARALRGSRGYKSHAARVLKCAIGTIDLYLKRYPELNQVLEDARERQIDDAETQLQNQIDQGNVPATIFFLKTQGKQRGFVERTEEQHSGSMTLDIRLPDVLLPGSDFAPEVSNLPATEAE